MTQRTETNGAAGGRGWTKRSDGGFDLPHSRTPGISLSSNSVHPLTDTAICDSCEYGRRHSPSDECRIAAIYSLPHSESEVYFVNSSSIVLAPCHAVLTKAIQQLHEVSNSFTCFSASSFAIPYSSCTRPTNSSRLPSTTSRSSSVSLPHFCCN